MLLITSDVYESEVFPNSNLMVPNLKYCHKVDHIQVKQKKKENLVTSEIIVDIVGIVDKAGCNICFVFL